MWSAVLNAVVYHFTLNYKELNTLLLSLQNLHDYEYPDTFCHSTVVYFTDNTVLHYIGASRSSGIPSLHALITSIRLLEIDLVIHIVVIHIPGVVMIDQVTDGLSQGI